MTSKIQKGKSKRIKLLQANEDKLLSAEKGLFYLWNVLCKPDGNYKA